MGLSARERRVDGKAPPGRSRDQTPGLAVRRTAASVLRHSLERGVPVDALLDEAHGVASFRRLDHRDRGLVRAIVSTALRRRGQIEAALNRVLDRKLPQEAGALAAILHVGAAQILFMDVPDHAAVSLAVTQAAAEPRTRGARGLVNSVLRRLSREREEILALPDTAWLNAPDWLRQRWSDTYGEAAALAIAAAHLRPPDLDIAAKSDRALWAERLEGRLLPTGTIRLEGMRRVSALPGYSEGAWWVQDAAAALPARLLGDVAGMRVVDLCAAPGGKTAQLAAAGAAVTAVDIAESRLKRLGGNLARLGLIADLVAADLLTWQPSRPFDAVLLDAPCSATGTIRRHPDVQWLKRPDDIPAMAEQQASMLDRAAGIVAPGGRLVYCTCSLEPEEGEAQVAPFLARHPGMTLEPIVADEVAGLSHLVTPDGTLRTLPCHGFGTASASAGMDGFFAARFRRR